MPNEIEFELNQETRNIPHIKEKLNDIIQLTVSLDIQEKVAPLIVNELKPLSLCRMEAQLLLQRTGHAISADGGKQTPIILDVHVKFYDKWVIEYSCFTKIRKLRKDIMIHRPARDLFYILIWDQPIDDDEYLVDVGCLRGCHTKVKVVSVPTIKDSWQSTEVSCKPGFEINQQPHPKNEADMDTDNPPGKMGESEAISEKEILRKQFIRLQQKQSTELNHEGYRDRSIDNTRISHLIESIIAEVQYQVEANKLKQLAHPQTDEYTETENSLMQIAKGLDPTNDQLSEEVYKIKKLLTELKQFLPQTK